MDNIFLWLQFLPTNPSTAQSHVLMNRSICSIYLLHNDIYQYNLILKLHFLRTRIWADEKHHAHHRINYQRGTRTRAVKGATASKQLLQIFTFYVIVSYATRSRKTAGGLGVGVRVEGCWWGWGLGFDDLYLEILICALKFDRQLGSNATCLIFWLRCNLTGSLNVMVTRGQFH